MIPLLDTHQHLIFRSRLGYGWTDAIPALAQGDFTPADYLALVAGKGVSGSLFMETGVDDAGYQTEARLIAGLVGQHGIAGQIASCRPEADGFDAWLEQSEALHIHGYRRILHVVPDDLSQSQTFRQNLRKIGAKGLAFDLCFLARQLPLAVDLAKACPDQNLVMDHCCNPDIAAGAFEPWAQGVTALAALPHVSCKLSGISAYCAAGTASVATLRPWVDHILNAFTPARIVWGSDWPVVNLGAGLPDWIDMTRALIADLSQAEQTAIASANARRLYALPDPAAA